MARSQFIEAQVLDEDFLSELEHQNTSHYFIDLADVADTTYSGSVGKYLKTTNSGIEFSDFSSLENIIFVAKSGAQFTSVKEALDSITDSGVFNRYSITIGPGIFDEDNPIQLKPWVSVRSAATKELTVVGAINSDEDLFIGCDRSFLSSMVLTGVSSGSALSFAVSGNMLVDDLILVDCEHGIFINNTDSFIEAHNIYAQTYTDTISEVFTVVSGTAVIRGFTVISDSTIETLIKCDAGSVTVFNMWSESLNVTNGLYVDNGGHFIGFSGEIANSVNAIRINNSSSIDLNNINVSGDTTNHILVEDTISHIHVIGCGIDRSKVVFPDGYINDTAIFLDTTHHIVSVQGSFTVGRPEYGTSSTFGGGRTCTRGMNVLTTDGTASTLSDGGNIVDVTSSASSTVSGTTFSFQGTTTDHTILVGSLLSDGADKLKAWGIRQEQTIAAVEVTPKSFVTEYWNGSAWSGCSNMATHTWKGYAYANELFIRANSSEHVGCHIPDDWTKKTINGENTYWLRFRIINDLTTSPVFDIFHLQTDRFKVGREGINTFHGKAKFKETLLAAGNIFGESGGVLDSSLDIGSGDIPTGWGHVMKNNKLNGSGDALYFQTDLHKGVCTSCPLSIKVLGCVVSDGASSDGTIIISALPVEVQGVKEADSSGGVIPVERTLANTKAFTTDQAQYEMCSVPFSDNTKMQSFEFNTIDISDYYEGDMVFIRIEMDYAGSANKDFLICGVEVSGSSWTNGERI